PGEPVQLYVELKNFANEYRGDAFETRLDSAVEISDTKGEKVWSHRFEDRSCPIRSRALLHDYSNNYYFFVPQLAPGNYLLTIHITDGNNEDNRRRARKTVEVRVGSSPR